MPRGDQAKFVIRVVFSAVIGLTWAVIDMVIDMVIDR